jgi:hypothetical protein
LYFLSVVFFLISAVIIVKSSLIAGGHAF